MTMANLNITNSIDNILHLTRPRRKTDSAVDKRPPIVLDPSPGLSKKPSVQVLQDLTRSHRRRASLTTSTVPEASRELSGTNPGDTSSFPSSSASKTSATLFSTLTTPPVPSLPPFIPLCPSTSKQRMRFSSPDMAAAADPRDRRAEPHATSSASTFAPATSSSKTSYLRPRFSHHYPSFFTSAEREETAEQQEDERPTSRFSFEYHLPLHEEALTATSTAAAAAQPLKAQKPQVLQIKRPTKHAQKSPPVAIALDPSSSSSSDPSDLSDATSSSAHRPRLHERRSVPNFSLPHVVSQSSSSSAEPSPTSKQQKQALELQQLSQQKQELFHQRHQRHQRHKSISVPLAPRDQNSLLAFRPGQEGGETTSGIINALRSNATKRKRQSTIIAQQIASRPSAKNNEIMPLSTLSYSPARSSFVADSKRRAAAASNSDGENTTPSRNNEDLFLNIARSDSTHRDALTRSESRRSRFGFNGASLRSPTSRANNNNTRNTPSPEQLRTNNPLRGRHISSASVAHTSASAHPLEDPGSRSSRLTTAPVGSSSRSTIGLPRSRLSRASLDASPKSPSGGAGVGAGSVAGVDRRSSLHEPRVFGGSSALSTIRSASRQPSAEPADRTPDKTRQDGSESTLSTNAPSTVWDELEGLKSRIRNLELTGKLPPSSQTAMSSTAADRPRTAATTVTTFSSPPKHKRKSSVAVPEPDVAQVHPLLQSALAKAKNVVTSDVYRTLENTVNDAASLSVLLGSGSFSSGSTSVANGYGTPDKHSKRKADSVCRGLTELCIALSDAQQQQQQQQQQTPTEEKGTPNASDKDQPPPYSTFQRSPSFEPDSAIRRRSTSRALARLESRRTSLVNGVGAGESDSAAPTTPETKQTITNITPQEKRQSQLFEQQQQQQQTTPQTPPQAKPSSGLSTGPKSRPSRLSVSMRASTYPAETKSPEDELAEKNTSHAMALSRTLTDVGTPSSNRFNARNRLSTGYVPYRPSLPSSPQEPSFTPQTPQTPAAQTQAPPPPPPHQPQLQSQLQSPEENNKKGEEKTELPRSPSLQALSLRRSFMAPVNYTPGTARTGIQSGSRRYGLSGYNTAAPSTLMTGSVAENPESFQQPESQKERPKEEPQEDILQKFATPSNKMVQQKSRSRTASLGTTLGTRRFGIRPRPVMNLENMVHL